MKTTYLRLILNHCYLNFYCSDNFQRTEHETRGNCKISLFYSFLSAIFFCIYPIFIHVISNLNLYVDVGVIGTAFVLVCGGNFVCTLPQQCH